MKTIITALLIAIIQTAYSQPQYWSDPVTFTTSHVDKNPSFGSRRLPSYLLYYWEFLIFERQSGSNSNICLLRVDQYGPQGSVIYLTNDNFINRNPCIGYGTRGGWMDSITYALAVWETNKNGKWDLYGKYYNYYTGWHNEFPVDSSINNKSNPHTAQLDSIKFGVVYEHENDIIYKIINMQNNSIIYDTNLTYSISADCSNPKIAYYNFNNIVVTYESKKSDGKKAIYYTNCQNIPNWSNPDTVAYIGDNRNLGFKSNYSVYTESLFESDRLGNWNIYVTSLAGYPSYQDTIIINPNADNTDFEGYLYPIIFFPDEESYFNAGAYLEKTQDSIKLRLTDASNYYTDSVIIGDTTKDVSLTMNNGIYVGDVLVWVVFNKDSASFSNLYGVSKIIITGNVKKIGNEIPSTYKLHQNYPNPFNPKTKIIFDIPRSSHVKLIIYDALGREVATLVNEKLSAGSYEASWDGSDYPSGVYFYNLITKTFKETKRMVLIK